MPFNAGGQTYQGGSYLAQGIGNLGQGIASGIQQLQQAQQNEAADNVLLSFALQSGQITPQQFAEFKDMPRTKKDGVVAGLARQFAMQQQMDQHAALQESQRAQAELRQQQAAAFAFEPSEEQKALVRATGNEMIKMGPGKFALAPYGGSGQDEVQTDPLKVGGKTIPGIGVNRKTGQYVYFPQDMGGGMKIEIEPKTGVPFYKDIKGNPHPLTGQQIMSGQMLPPDQSAQPSPTPAGGAGGLTMDDILNAIGSIGAMSPADLPGGGAGLPTGRRDEGVPAPQSAAATGNDVAAAPSQQARSLDPATAKMFLQQAGGDKNKARELARAAGYVF